MILAIDIGGTKTLVAPCDNNGKPVSEYKFPTPQSYDKFKKELSAVIATITTDYSLLVVAAPGKINRKDGSVIRFGNLPWQNVPLKEDLHKITGKTVLIDNDANLAGLSEANRIKPLPHIALYITISTGIGTGIIKDGVIDPDFADSEGGAMLFEHDGQLLRWEQIESGKAIVAQYGKRASDLNSKAAWNDIARWFAIGIVNLATVLEPDVVIIGGGVGTHFNKYQSYLNKHIATITPKLVDVPKVVAAQAPEEAVIYGCAELAKQYYAAGNNT